ncbi:MAG: Rab family GTPase [Candidatus Thermoplasmatota archaeon]|nr:Rab family GTPase [Candidatus Thermoplasmatota archaeon]
MTTYVKKICLLGDGAVGKTSLIRRYVYDVFEDKYIATIGTKVTKKTISINSEEKITLLIYDILGQKKFEKLHSVYYRGASGALIVSDITRAETIEHMRSWCSSLFEVVGIVPVVLIVNKVDLKRYFPEELKKLSSEINAKYYFTSAKIGENVEEAFLTIAKSVIGI